MHTNAYKTKIPLFQGFLLYVVMSRGLINKSCLSKGLNLNRVHLISAPHRFLADCSVSASVGIMWCSACPQSCQSRQSLGWEMVRARINISRVAWTVTASLLLSPSPAYTQAAAAAAASAQSNAAGGAEELLPHLHPSNKTLCFWGVTLPWMPLVYVLESGDIFNNKPAELQFRENLLGNLHNVARGDLTASPCA